MPAFIPLVNLWYVEGLLFLLNRMDLINPSDVGTY